jgi:hypothetical protein
MPREGNGTAQGPHSPVKSNCSGPGVHLPVEKSCSCGRFLHRISSSACMVDVLLGKRAT